MRALNVIDHVLLTLETPKTPMHVAGLCVFELPDEAGEDFVANIVADMMASPMKPTFPFNQVLNKRFFWQKNDSFDIHHHFRHVVLPKGAGMAELMNHVSCEHEVMMDRGKPLWELHLIEGLDPATTGENPRCALYFKIHHAMADGVAVMRILQMSLAKVPNESITTPFWVLPSKNRHKNSHLLPKRKTPLHLIKEQLATIYPVGLELIKGFKNRFDKQNPHFVSTFDAPKSILNQRIGTSRHLAFASFDKGRFAKIAKHFGATTNDVLLAVCAGALRAYLQGQNALPNKPLIAFVPISLRRDGSAVGNQLSFILANLATHEPDPATRLAVISASVNDGKQRFSRMSPAQVVNYSLLTYALAFANLTTGLMPTRQVFNLIISNVPGNEEQMYLGGARLTGLFPASVLLDGQALNITMANYQDKIDFGLVACPSVLPDIKMMVDLLENELAVFEGLMRQAHD